MFLFLTNTVNSTFSDNSSIRGTSSKYSIKNLSIEKETLRFCVELSKPQRVDRPCEYFAIFYSFFVDWPQTKHKLFAFL